MTNLTEILEKYFHKPDIAKVFNKNCPLCGISFEKETWDKHIAQAVKEIRELVLGKLPNVRVSFGEDCKGCQNSSRCKFCGVACFNQALSQIREVVEKI